MWLTHALNVGYHILILGSFLAGFYFLYVSKIITRMINSQFTEIAKNVTQNYASGINLDKNGWQAVKSASDFIVKSTEKPNQEVINNNRKIVWMTVGFFTLFGLVLLGITIYYRNQINICSIITDNLFVFILVGIVEVYFFTQIAINYTPVYPSQLKNTVLETIQEHFAKADE